MIDEAMSWDSSELCDAVDQLRGHFYRFENLVNDPEHGELARRVAQMWNNGYDPSLVVETKDADGHVVKLSPDSRFRALLNEASQCSLS